MSSKYKLYSKKQVKHLMDLFGHALQTFPRVKSNYNCIARLFCAIYTLPLGSYTNNLMVMIKDYHFGRWIYSPFHYIHKGKFRKCRRSMEFSLSIWCLVVFLFLRFFWLYSSFFDVSIVNILQLLLLLPPSPCIEYTLLWKVLFI